MIRAALVIALLALSAHASAAGLSLCNLCAGYTVSKRADGAVVIRCPGNPTPIFVLRGCNNPSVTRVGSNATISCR